MIRVGDKVAVHVKGWRGVVGVVVDDNFCGDGDRVVVRFSDAWEGALPHDVLSVIEPCPLTADNSPCRLAPGPDFSGWWSDTTLLAAVAAHMAAGDDSFDATIADVWLEDFR